MKVVLVVLVGLLIASALALLFFGIATRTLFQDVLDD